MKNILKPFIISFLLVIFFSPECSGVNRRRRIFNFNRSDELPARVISDANTDVVDNEIGDGQWQRVVEKGFNDPKNDYAWSMASFKGRLYVGTLNSLWGAEIWSSSNGAPNTWTRSHKSYVISNNGVRYLYADGDSALYAGTFSKLGAQILRTTNGLAWTSVIQRGFGDRTNDTIRCMVRFGEYLYAGTGHNGAELYRSKDGFNWELADVNPKFTSTKVLDPLTNTLITNNIMIGELAVFNNQLYAFTWTTDLGILSQKFRKQLMNQNANGTETPEFFARTPGAFEVWRSSNGADWEKVVGLDDAYGNGMGFSLHDEANMANDVVTSVAVYNGHLYLGPQNANGRTALWRTADGTQWEKILDFWSLGELFNFYIWRMISFKQRLYIGTFNLLASPLPAISGGQIWVTESGDPGTFYKIVSNGFDGETICWLSDSIRIPKNYGIRSFAVHNNQLFAGTATIFSIPVPKFQGSQIGITIAGKDVGCEIWRMSAP